MTGLEWTHKCSKRNSVINIQDFPARNASGRASIALRRSAKAVLACRRWSPPASCTCTCIAAVDAILHSFKNAQVVILDNDRSLSRITTCKCALCIDDFQVALSWEEIERAAADCLVLSIATKMVFPGERKPFPFYFVVRVSRADSQLTWTYTCRLWE